MIHVACPITLDGVTGVSPIHLGREAIGVALTLEMRAACLFGTSARPAGYIKVPAGTTPEVAKKNSALWEAAQGGAENSGRTPVLFDGMEFVPLTFNSVDAQFIESRREQVVEIARLFNVPATMLQEMSKGTFANTEQQARHFIKHNLTHWLNTIREELERALLTEEERDEYEIAFDTEALVAVDTLAATGRLKELRASGIATANEARAELGYEARPDGDALGSPFTTAGTPAPTPSKDTAE